MSGTRNFKRLGAPGHYINVRYDDAHVRLCRNGRGGPAIAQRGFDKTHSKELFDVKEGELLLAKKISHTRDGYSHCFTSLNGYPLDPSKSQSVDELRKAIFDECMFIGVANTPFSSEDPSMEQGFTAQVGGVLTLKHMGSEVLHPGDLVRIDISDKPLRHVKKGTPPLKELLVLRKASPTHTAASLGLGTGASVDDLVKAMAKASGRVIGKAMSLARSGDSVDILLFHRSI